MRAEVPLALALAAPPALATSYEELRAEAVARCGAIDPGAYQTGLYLNPDGYRSYYERSACFQTAAEQFRDALLHDDGYNVDATSELRILLRREDVEARIAGFAPGRPYRVRATLVLDPGRGGPAG